MHYLFDADWEETVEKLCWAEVQKELFTILWNSGSGFKFSSTIYTVQYTESIKSRREEVGDLRR